MGRGAIVIGAWEELVKQTACEVMGNKLIACDREVQRWEEGVWKVKRGKTEGHTKCPSSNTAARWEEYAVRKTKAIVKKKGMWIYVV